MGGVPRVGSHQSRGLLSEQRPEAAVLEGGAVAADGLGEREGGRAALRVRELVGDHVGPECAKRDVLELCTCHLGAA